MTWDEIRVELVRRWPEKFMLDEDDPCYMLELGIHVFPDSLDDISEICKAIGAVVWSEPFDKTGELWEGCTFAFDVSKICESREEAELAALGEWLKATSE